MKNCALLMMLAGIAATTPALAQDFIPCGPVITNIRVTPEGYAPNPGGYQNRDILPVYSNLAAGGFYLGNCASAMDDISFTNGPWAIPGANHLITEMNVGVYSQTTNIVNEQVIVILWNSADVNFQGFAGANTNMIRSGAAPKLVLRLSPPAGPPTLATNLIVDLTVLPGGGLLLGPTENSFYMQVTWVTNGFTPSVTPATSPNPDWSNLATNASGHVWSGFDANGVPNTAACPFASSDRSTLWSNTSNAGVGGNPSSPGFTTNAYGRDIGSPALEATRCPDIGQFIGNGAGPATGASEHRRIVDGNGSDAYGYRCEFKGDVQAQLPSPLQADFGCIGASTATNSSTVSTGQVKWYKMCFEGDVRDIFLQYADIDTEGSAGDVSIGLYRMSGQLIGTDNNSGSGNHDQLTYGVGIRERVGDGRQYDGRSGEFLAGDYYLGVAPAGSTFNFGFDVTQSGAAGGAYTVNVRSNVATGTLAPSATPYIAPGRDLGTINCPINSNPEVVTVKNINWYSFTTDFDTSTALDRYLDISFSGPGHTQTGDPQAFIFDSSGNYVTEDDDSGDAALSQFSFNHPSSLGGPAARPAIPPITPGDPLAGLPFDGQDGELAPGTYYMGVGVYQVLTLTSQNRWHLRATGTTTPTVAMTFTTGAVCSSCPPCAADFNDDGGVDGADIEAFFVTFSAGESCADVNQDGGVDGADIEAFFALFSAGGCL